MYIPKERVAKAREMDLLTYLRLYEPHELIKVGSNSYKMRSHGSLKLSNGKWMWWSRNVGGVSALDYLIEVEGMPFLSAVRQILDLEGIPPTKIMPEKTMEEPVIFHLPAPCHDNERVVTYLKLRGIDAEIISACIEQGLIYESKPYHNVVFVGYDWNGKAAYAAYRATRKERIMGEVKGSSKAFSFRFVGTGHGAIHVFESAIDVLSFLTIKRQEDRRSWQSLNCLSIGGVTSGTDIPEGLKNYLVKYNQTDEIVLHFDNDHAGRTAGVNLIEALKDKYMVRAEYPTCGKDMNDELLCRKDRFDRRTETR